jgi:uncharacterized protein YigA (DUF484 family)
MDSKEIKNQIVILQDKLKDSRNHNENLEDEISKLLKEKYENDPTIKGSRLCLSLGYCAK